MARLLWWCGCVAGFYSRKPVYPHRIGGSARWVAYRENSRSSRDDVDLEFVESREFDNSRAERERKNDYCFRSVWVGPSTCVCVCVN